MRFSVNIAALRISTAELVQLVRLSLQEAAEEYELRLSKLFEAGTCVCLQGIHVFLGNQTEKGGWHSH